MEITKIPLERLRPDPANPNIMTARQRKQLRESLARFGFQQPLVVTSDHMIVNGNQKYAAVMEDDDLKRTFPALPCHVLPATTTGDEILLIQQALNKIHGEHDKQADADIIRRLLDSDRLADITAILGVPEDTARLLAEPPAVPEPEDITEQAAELPPRAPVTTKCPHCGGDVEWT